MKLKTILILLCAVPLAGLVVCAAISWVLSETIHRQITLAKDESAVFAGVARQMQLDVVQVQQWLTDISATRGQDGLADGYDEADKSRQSFLAGLDKFRQMYQRENEAARLNQMEELQRAFNGYYEAGRVMAAAYVKEGTTAGNKTMGTFDQAAKQLSASLDPFIQEQIEELNRTLAQVQTNSTRTSRGMLIGGLILIGLTSTLAVILIRMITTPITHATNLLAEGSVQTAEAAGGLSMSSQTLAAGTSEQAASQEETCSSLEDVSTVSLRNGERAQQAHELVGQARRAAEAGVQDMDEMKQAVADMNSAGEISAASREQAGAAHQINTAMSQIGQVTQGNAAASEEIAAASEELNAQAEVMRHSMKELVQLIDGSLQTGGTPGGGAVQLRPAKANREPLGAGNGRPRMHSPQTAGPGRHSGERAICEPPKRDSCRWRLQDF